MKRTLTLGLLPFEFSQITGKPLNEVHNMIRDNKLMVIDTKFGREVLVTYTWFENEQE